MKHQVGDIMITKQEFYTSVHVRKVKIVSILNEAIFEGLCLESIYEDGAGKQYQCNFIKYHNQRFLSETKKYNV